MDDETLKNAIQLQQTKFQTFVQAKQETMAKFAPDALLDAFKTKTVTEFKKYLEENKEKLVELKRNRAEFLNKSLMDWTVSLEPPSKKQRAHVDDGDDDDEDEDVLLLLNPTGGNNNKSNKKTINMQRALALVRDVRSHCRTETSEAFLDVLKQFHNGEVTKPLVIHRMKTILKDYPDYLATFMTFAFDLVTFEPQNRQWLKNQERWIQIVLCCLARKCPMKHESSGHLCLQKAAKTPNKQQHDAIAIWIDPESWKTKKDMRFHWYCSDHRKDDDRAIISQAWNQLLHQEEKYNLSCIRSAYVSQWQQRSNNNSDQWQRALAPLVLPKDKICWLFDLDDV